MLNPAHGEGRHKARMFESALGTALDHARRMRKALVDASAHSDAVIAKRDNGFPDVYVVRFSMPTPRGAGTVLSAWIVLQG